jgi:hypothetical protein
MRRRRSRRPIRRPSARPFTQGIGFPFSTASGRRTASVSQVSEVSDFLSADLGARHPYGDGDDDLWFGKGAHA